MNDFIADFGSVVFSGVLTAFFAGFLTKVLYIKENRKKVSSEGFQLAKELYSEGGLESKRDYLLELAFCALTGKTENASIVRHLMTRKSPLRMIQDYSKGRKYLQVKRDKNGNAIGLRLDSKVGTRFKLKRKLTTTFLGYLAAASIAFLSLTFYEELQVVHINMSTIILFASLSTAFSVMSVIEHKSLCAALRCVGIYLAKDCDR